MSVPLTHTTSSRLCQSTNLDLRLRVPSAVVVAQRLVPDRDDATHRTNSFSHRAPRIVIDGISARACVCVCTYRVPWQRDELGVAREDALEHLHEQRVGRRRDAERVHVVAGAEQELHTRAAASDEAYAARPRLAAIRIYVPGPAWRARDPAARARSTSGTWSACRSRRVSRTTSSPSAAIDRSTYTRSEPERPRTVID